jgi:hypothetical protein
MKTVNIVGGGTFNFVRNHLALAAPAFGETAKAIAELCTIWELGGLYVFLALTKMADSASDLVTNEDLSEYADYLIGNPDTKVIFWNVAMTDFDGSIGEVKSGKYAERLKTNHGAALMTLTPSDKVLKKIRKHRKDIFLVAFKTTCGATEDEQYLAGLNLLKANSCNLVLANDTVTRTNMIIVPEEAIYEVTTNRQIALKTLVEMAYHRSKLTFTRSTIIPGETVDWNGELVPQSLRTVVNHCITKGAYKTFRGVTAGHFAFKINDTTFVTSKRKTDYNNLNEVGLVKIESKDRDTVIAHGFRPSVGGQSQRIVFEEHPEMDCIVHFHCPLKSDTVSMRPQQWLECGSHECGKNTSDGLTDVGNGIKAVFLDEHGPNIVFNHKVDPQLVIAFIDKSFDLSAKTGGLTH